MAYDAQYYEQKRIDLTNRIVKKMEDCITKLSSTLNEFYEDKNDLVKQLQEVVKFQQEEAATEVSKPSVEEQAAAAVAKHSKNKK